MRAVPAMLDEVARRRGSWGGGAHARTRDDRLRAIERPNPCADSGGQLDAALHGGQRARGVVLALGALRCIVHAGALCAVVRLQCRGRDPEITRVG